MQYLSNFIFIGLILSCISTSLMGQVDVQNKSNLEENKTSEIDLSGTWQIEVSQEPWYGMSIFEDDDNGITKAKITQKGDKITGKISCFAYFAEDKGTLQYTQKFDGKFDGQTFLYQDTEVKGYINNHESMRKMETCLKTAELEFSTKGGYYYLEGNWSGYGHISGGLCSPGKIIMKKRIPDIKKKKNNK